MKFTYDAYKNMILRLKEHGYIFSNYFDYRIYDKSVIMRHDVDNDLGKALKLSGIEHEMGVTSTYFVLATSNFYNIFSKKNRDILRFICDMGHSVGLHFDETQYSKVDENWWQEAVDREIYLLEQCVGREVTSVSMHRPSKDTLNSDWDIRSGKVVNSYGKEFFENHKYLSDSRRNWKEDVLGIIEKEQYNRLHILVHPFWYNETEETTKDVLATFCKGQIYQCYDELDRNTRNLSELLMKQELLVWEKVNGEDNGRGTV